MVSKKDILESAEALPLAERLSLIQSLIRTLPMDESAPSAEHLDEAQWTEIARQLKASEEDLINGRYADLKAGFAKLASENGLLLK